MYKASGLTDNNASGLHSHLGHNNCYLPSSIFDEETEAQRGNNNLSWVHESSDLNQRLPGSEFSALEDQEHTLFSNLRRLSGSLLDEEGLKKEDKEVILHQEPKG